MPGLRFENNVTYGELHYAAYLLILTKNTCHKGNELTNELII